MFNSVVQQWVQVFLQMTILMLLCWLLNTAVIPLCTVSEPCSVNILLCLTARLHTPLVSSNYCLSQPMCHHVLYAGHYTDGISSLSRELDYIHHCTHELCQQQVKAPMPGKERYPSPPGCRLGQRLTSPPRKNSIALKPWQPWRPCQNITKVSAFNAAYYKQML